MTDTTTLDDDPATIEAEAEPTPERPAGRWRCLAYADGPLAGRSAMFGFWPDDAIPERLTATAGTVYGTRPVPVPGSDPPRFHYLPTEIATTPGNPVRYELRDGAYRFVGEGYWPGDEPEEDETASDDDLARDETA